MSINSKKIFVTNHYKFLDKIVYKKRIEIADLINKETKNFELNDALDIGTTEDNKNESSNTIIKSLKRAKVFKSISNQDIKSSFFEKKLNKSITKDFTKIELEEFSSDIVLSNATIEHVGNQQKQRKMLDNIIKLSKKVFVISTPNRSYPIDFHTKIPFIHWLPKNLHRKILKIIGLSFYAKVENLNLLNKKDLILFMKEYNLDYKIYDIKLFNLSTNLILIGIKKKLDFKIWTFTIN